MFLDLEDFAEEHFVSLPDEPGVFRLHAKPAFKWQAEDFDAGRFEPGNGQAFDECGGIGGQRNVIAEPGQRNEHGVLPKSEQPGAARP